MSLAKHLIGYCRRNAFNAKVHSKVMRATSARLAISNFRFKIIIAVAAVKILLLIRTTVAIALTLYPLSITASARLNMSLVLKDLSAI
jgi:hypothetical protein